MNFRRIGATITSAAVVTFTLTGCFGIDMSTTIHADGATADVTYKLSYNKEVLEPNSMIGMGGIKPAENDEFAEFLKLDSPSGSDSMEESVNQDETAASLAVTACEDLFGNEDQMPDGGKSEISETSTHCVLTKTYTNVPYDEKGITGENANDMKNSVQITRVGNNAKVEVNFIKELEVGSFEFMDSASFTVTFPNKVVETTAGGKISEDGKTVTWDMEALKKSLEDEVTPAALGAVKANNTGLYIGIGALVLLVGGGVVLLVTKKKSTGTSTDVDADSTQDTTTA